MGEVVLKKHMVEINVGDGEFVTIPADDTGVEGLVVHRQQKHSQKEGGDRRSTSYWQITHVGTGAGIYSPGTGLETRAEAIELCQRLAEMGDWSGEVPPLGEKGLEKFRRIIEDARQRSQGEKEEADLEKALKRAQDSGLSIKRRRKDGERYFAVIDATGKELATFRHAGQASAYLRERSG